MRTRLGASTAWTLGNSIAGLVGFAMLCGAGCDNPAPPTDAGLSNDGGMDAGPVLASADAGSQTGAAADGGKGLDAGSGQTGVGAGDGAQPMLDAGDHSEHGDAAAVGGNDNAGSGGVVWIGGAGAPGAGAGGVEAGHAGSSDAAGTSGGSGAVGADEDAGSDGEAGSGLSAGSGGQAGVTAGSSGGAGGGAGSAGAAGSGTMPQTCQSDPDCATGQICGPSGSNTCSNCSTDLECQDDTDTYGTSFFCDPTSQRCSILCASCGGCEQIQTVGTNNYHTTDPIDYPDPPPTSGPHNPCWARWGVHDTAVPDERWVHNLEHGGIVFLYNCPDGCSSDIATLTQLVDARDRTVLTEYDALPGQFAVVAWGHRLITSCVDPVAFAKFYTEDFDHGAESDDAQPDDSCPP